MAVALGVSGCVSDGDEHRQAGSLASSEMSFNVLFTPRGFLGSITYIVYVTLSDGENTKVSHSLEKISVRLFP